MGTEREISTITGKPIPLEEEKFRAGKWLSKQMSLPKPGDRRQYGVWPFDLTPKKYFEEASIYNPPKGSLDPVGVIHRDQVIKNLTENRVGIYKDLLTDYIKKIPQKILDPVADIYYRDLPLGIRGRHWAPGVHRKRSIIELADLPGRYGRLKGLESRALQTASTLAHELTHSMTYGKFAEKAGKVAIEKPIMRKHMRMFDDPFYKEKYYWDNPFERIARRVARRFIKNPGKLESHYLQESARSLPNVPITDPKMKDYKQLLRMKSKVAEKLKGKKPIPWPREF